jgi:hypothetical protein
MIRTTLLLYLLLMLSSLYVLRQLYADLLARRTVSVRLRERFIRRSAALVVAFHLLYFGAFALFWCAYKALG